MEFERYVTDRWGAHYVFRATEANGFFLPATLFAQAPHPLVWRFVAAFQGTAADQVAIRIFAGVGETTLDINLPVVTISGTNTAFVSESIPAERISATFTRSFGAGVVNAWFGVSPFTPWQGMVVQPEAKYRARIPDGWRGIHR